MKKKIKPKCVYCWDKGYASELVSLCSIPDFFGDKQKCVIKEIRNYCMRCAKGKRLKLLAIKKKLKSN